MRAITRREVVAAGAVSTAGLSVAVPDAWARRLLSRRPGMGPGRFVDGVASGEPSHNAVTFWSRLRTNRVRSGARLIVARDAGLRRVVATAVVPTGRGVNHTLKVRVGGLRPHTEYYFGWESTTSVSPIGRTRTLPHPSSNLPLRIAFSSCQHYSFGHFSPHAHAAAEELDLYLFLGDYIYERGRSSSDYVGRRDVDNAVDLRSYRAKYRRYRKDPGLRELHRLHPGVHTWDDHEVENNYSDNAPPPPPLQRAAAYRAAFEWIPRVVFPRDRHRIYKRFALGRTAEVFLLDTRQYRTGHGDGQPARLLGDAQMSWLIAGLHSSRARWKILANQVTVAANSSGEERRADKWDGYPEDRARLLGEIERAGIRDVVFLTGDAHVFMCNVLATDFESLGDGSGRTPAAVEYVGGSVTTPGRDLPEQDVRSASPWVRQYNGRDHGYALLSLDDAGLTTEYRRSDLSSPTGGTGTFERFFQPAGVNDVSRETVPPPV